jgi:hypothetical protein
MMRALFQEGRRVDVRLHVRLALRRGDLGVVRVGSPGAGPLPSILALDELRVGAMRLSEAGVDEVDRPTPWVHGRPTRAAWFAIVDMRRFVLLNHRLFLKKSARPNVGHDRSAPPGVGLIR